MKFTSRTFIYRFLFVFALLAAIVIIHSCKKDNSSSKSQTVTDPSISTAKQWYESTYPVANSSSSKLVTENAGTAVVFDFSQHIKPDWLHPSSYARSGDKVIEMPIDPSFTFGSVLNSSSNGTPVYPAKNSRSSFLLLNDGTDYTGYIMTIIADSAYLKNDLIKLNNLKYNKRDTDFSGAVIYHTPNGNFVSGWFYTNGVITGQILAKNKSENGGTKATTPVVQSLKTNEEEVCTDWYQTYTVNGVTSAPEYTGTTCVSVPTGSPGGSSSGSSSSPSVGTNPTTGGGTGTATTSPCTTPAAGSNSALLPRKTALTAQPGAPGASFPPPTSTPCVTTKVNKITNNVTNPCLRSMVQATISDNVTNQINSLIQNVFGSSTTMNITFVDVTTLPNFVDGSTNTNGGLVNNTLNVQIQLDDNHLPNYSQQYVARVIMHEALHAYLTAIGTSESQQHESMIVNYVTQMASSLQEMFPSLSLQDAKNLALGGLQVTTTFQNTVENDMGLSGSFSATNSAYSIGSLGVKCN